MAKLVAIGDSLTQGSMSLATCHTNLSYPAIVAQCMGLGTSEFVTPNFMGRGGLPFNLEWMARNLERKYGHDINLFEWVGATYHIASMLDDVEDYWERGRGSRAVADQLYHNLGIWDYEVSDAYTTTAQICDGKIGSDKDEWLQPPSHGRLRIARRVLNPAKLPSRQNETQLDVAGKIKDRDGSIEHLLLCLGANNCVGTVFSLDVFETGPSSPGPGTGFTLWTKAAFEQEYLQLAAGIDAIGADNVYVDTVPHVTVMPVVKSVMNGGGDLPAGEKYFDYYPRVWMTEKGFNVSRDRYLNKVESETIDSRVDEFNDVITSVAAARGWKVVDLCKMVDDLAWYRNQGNPTYVLPPEIDDLDLRFFAFDDHGNRTQGGLVSLDGMHPTTCGYGLFAQAFIDQIKTVDPTVNDVDFADVRTWDSLVTAPPKTVHDIGGMLAILEKHFHFSRWITLSDDSGLGIR